MSIWKSPVFYFGVALVLLVAAALAAPYVVPWNNYREDLQSYGEKLTGRDVSIDGDINVKLFPWPQLVARNVAIGNPAGFSGGAFVKADELRVTLSLAGLFNGGLDVQSVDVVAPQVNLQRNATGQVNWIFAPTESVVGRGLLSSVRLDQIKLQNGIVSIDDLRNGYSSVLAGLNAELSAQSILGPWRMRGNAEWNDVPVAVLVTTNAKETDQPLKFVVKFSPLDVSYPHVGLDGAWDGKNFKGNFRVDPQEVSGEKSSAEGTFKPLALQAGVEASEERMSLLKIRIAPADRKDSGTLIEGDAVVEFGTQAVARIDLKSPRINLDTLVGAGTMRDWRDGGFLSVVNRLLAAVPSKFEANYTLAVSTLTSGGQSLSDVRMSGVMQKEAIRVREFAAELPGRSVAVFDGVLFPGEKSAQLGGSLKFESSDTRVFASWLDPSWKDAFDKHWTGSRGRLEVLNAKIDWAGDRFSLGDVSFRFDGMPGTARFAAGWAEEPRMELLLNCGQFDLDSLVPQGWSLIRDGGIAAAIQSVAPGNNRWTRRFNLRAGSVLLNGVTAQEVALDTEVSPTGLMLKNFDVGSVSGARLRGGGALTDKGVGPEGELSFKLDAQNPQGFVRLLGLDAQWMEALGQTAIEANLTAIPQKTGQELRAAVKGSSGSLVLDLLATASELENGTNARIAASGGLSSSESAAIARLIGIQSRASTGAGDVSFEVNGSLHQGFVLSTTVKAFNASTTLEGRADFKQPWLGINGKFTSATDDGAELLRAIGVPVETVGVQPLNVSAVVSTKDGSLSLIDLAGNVAGRRFSGTAGVDAKGMLIADIETDEIDIRQVLSLAFMPWEGPAAELSQGFATIGGGGSKAEVFIKPLQFDPLTSTPASEVVVAIGADASSRSLSITAPGENALKLDAVLRPRGASFDTSVEMQWPVELGTVIATQDTALVTGQMMVQGALKSSGRSPAAMLAAVEGSGSYGLQNAAFPRMTLSGLAKSIADAKTQDELAGALKTFESLPGTQVGQRVGTLKAANGEIVFTDFELAAEGVTAVASPKFDLSTNALSLASEVKITSPQNLPPLTVGYSGSPGAMTVRNGTSALAAKLGYELLAKEMAELERLQKEQEALAAKEEAQRKADEQRFADYQYTRVELRKQTSVRRFHKTERERKAIELRDLIANAVKNGPAISRVELQRIHTRMADDRFRSPRVLSISPTSADMLLCSTSAASFKADQNSGSSDIDVRWPAMVSDRLSSLGIRVVRACGTPAPRLRVHFQLLQGPFRTCYDRILRGSHRPFSR
jgi:hypothetical protein